MWATCVFSYLYYQASHEINVLRHSTLHKGSRQRDANAPPAFIKFTIIKSLIERQNMTYITSKRLLATFGDFWRLCYRRSKLCTLHENSSCAHAGAVICSQHPNCYCQQHFNVHANHFNWWMAVTKISCISPIRPIMISAHITISLPFFFILF